MSVQEEIQTQGARSLWVVFTGQTDLRWLFCLKRGFRHCFVVMHDGSRWLSVDPLASHMEVTIQDIPQDFNLPVWLRTQGHYVVEARSRVPLRPAPFMPLTCVEVVKRMLGVHKRFIFTPWQLYRYLSRGAAPGFQEKNSNQEGEKSWEV